MENKTLLMSKNSFYLGFFSEVLIIAISVGVVWGINQFYSFSSFIIFLFFFAIQTIVTVFFLLILNYVFKFKPGVFTSKRYPKIYEAYLLYLFLYAFNLGIYWQIIFPGMLTRPILYKILGCKLESTSIVNVVKIHDPLFVEIGHNTFLGSCNLYGHAITLIKGEPALILGKIVVGENTIIGTESIVMPDVKIGNDTLIQVASFIPMGARIPSNEVWSGHPIKKVGGAS